MPLGTAAPVPSVADGVGGAGVGPEPVVSSVGASSRDRSIDIAAGGDSVGVLPALPVLPVLNDEVADVDVADGEGYAAGVAGEGCPEASAGWRWTDVGRTCGPMMTTAVAMTPQAIRPRFVSRTRATLRRDSDEAGDGTPMLVPERGG